MTLEPARGSLDVEAESRQHWKVERRSRLLTVRFTDEEMYLLRAATNLDQPTVTDVIRARLFGPLPPVGRR